MDDEELLEHLSQAPVTPGPHPSVVLAAVPIENVLERLLLFFESSTAYAEVRIQRGDVVLGYLQRDSLLWIVPTTRGIGDADHFALLGESDDDVLTLECPVAGCQHELSLVLLPADALLTCPYHDGIALRVRT